jgi:hypothetical protein
VIELRHHRLEAAAIAVALDHRAAFGRHRVGAQPLPVRFNRGQIDRQHAAGFIRGRAVDVAGVGKRLGFVNGHVDGSRNG